MKKFLDFLKEYLSIILIIPTLIGGLYQIINIIYYFGFPYVRFFSVAQVIPDGILVGIFIIYFSLIVLFFKEILKFFSNNIDNIGGVKFNIFQLVVLLLMLILFSWRFIKSQSETVIALIMTDFFWLSLIILILCIIFVIVINLTIGNIEYKTSRVLYWVFLIAYIGYFSTEFEEKILIVNEKIIRDDQFYNPDILINRISEKNQTINVSLLYANRDYLFFSIKKDGNKKILVEDAKKLTSLDEIKSD